jgi:hypothetical protein
MCLTRDGAYWPLAHASDAVYGLILPEAFELVGRHGRVAHGMLNVPMPQIILNGPRILPPRREVRSVMSRCSG